MPRVSWMTTMDAEMTCSPAHSACMPRGARLAPGCFCAVSVYKRHLESTWSCLMAAANGFCLSRERRNVSAVPTAPCIVFQLLSLRLAYHGFNKQCAQLDTERPTSAQVWGKHFSPHHQPYLCFLWVFLDLSPLASPLTTVRFLSVLEYFRTRL